MPTTPSLFELSSARAYFPLELTVAHTRSSPCIRMITQPPSRYRIASQVPGVHRAQILDSDFDERGLL